MSLIPLPWEGGERKKVKIKVKPLKKGKRSHEFNLLKFTAKKFIDYINNFKKWDEKKIDSLILFMQRSILLLQRRKVQMLVKKNLKVK